MYGKRGLMIQWGVWKCYTGRTSQQIHYYSISHGFCTQEEEQQTVDAVNLNTLWLPVKNLL